MTPILLNETEFGKMCAGKIDDRTDLTLHFECYPDEDSDVMIEFTVLWREIEAKSYFPGEALSYDEGRNRAEVKIYNISGYREGEEVLLIYSEESLIEEIEYNLNR